MEEAAKTCPTSPPHEDVLNGLWSIKDNDIGGLTYPLTFPKMGNSPKKACWGVVVIKDKKFIAPKGSAVACKK